MSTPKQILIVGGGYTGLTAALRLSASKNYSVTLVESSDHLGGLTAGFSLLGTSIEKTYHHLFLTDTAVLALIKEIGLSDKLTWHESSVGIFRDRKLHAFKTALDLLKFPPCNFSGCLRTGLVALYLKHRYNWRCFTWHTAHAWMTRACGLAAMETIWTPLLKGKFAHHYDRVSMAWFWARIHIRANSRTGGGGEKLGYICGGFNLITSALESELRKRGVKIQTRATVEKITNDHVAVINGRIVPFDDCVFTGSSPAFAGLLPLEDSLTDYAARLRSIEYLGAVSLVFTSDQSLCDFYWVNVNEPDAPFLVFIQHTQLVGRQHYGGKNVYYIGAYLAPDSKTYSLPDEELVKLWLDYLGKIYPALDVAQIHERHVFRFRDAQHIVNTEYEAKIPPHQTPLSGVWLANFSQIFPEDRGINFAVREGENIAALVCSAEEKSE